MTKAQLRGLNGIIMAEGKGLFWSSRLERLQKLSGPISRDIAILSLRYPISRDTFAERLAAPQRCDIEEWKN